MKPTAISPRNARLVNELSNAAIDLQALAQRLAKAEGVSIDTRVHVIRLAEAGRAAALAAVAVNDGNHTDALRLHYGTFLTTSARRRDALDPLEEEGLLV